VALGEWIHSLCYVAFLILAVCWHVACHRQLRLRALAQKLMISIMRDGARCAPKNAEIFWSRCVCETHPTKGVGGTTQLKFN
jgi:hypothetical protein